jgi:pimeloyl-ACP methyl ester carboxylesterase
MDATRLQVDRDVDVIAYLSPGWTTDTPVAVLLHGIGMTHRTFERMQPELAATMPVVSFDMPGFGATGHPPRPFSVMDHAAAVEAALQRLGVGRRLLVGHSMGAQFAVQLAILRPDAVAGMVLVGPVVDPARSTLGAQSRDLGRDTLREPPYANARIVVDYVRGGIGWYLENVRAMFEYPTEERIRLTTAPVVVVRGEHDPVAREPWCRALASAAGGPSELVTVTGHAHGVPLTGPAAVAGVVARFAEGRVQGTRR